MISDETLDWLRGHDPELWRQLTRRPVTMPAPVVNPPRITQIDARRIVLALYTSPDDTEDDADIIEGEWRNVA